MSRSANRAWMAFCLIGIALWVGVTVLVAVVNDDPSDGAPVLLAFAGGAALFFGVVFGVALWQTRPRRDPELDALLAELSLEPGTAADSAAAISGMRGVARVYIVLGALVTALALAAILEQGLGVGSPRTTLYVTVGIVVCWALAVPLVLRRASAASTAVLAPLGLTQAGANLAGERRGRRVSITITTAGSITKVGSDGVVALLEGNEISAYSGRGDARTWADVKAQGDGSEITVRRRGHDRASWLWDLWLAERLAGERI